MTLLTKYRTAILFFATPLLLALAFPPISLSYCAVFAFVPLLLLMEKLDSFGKQFRFAYGSFFLFSLFTLYWVGGFTHGKDIFMMLAGGTLLLWQPFFFCIPFSIYLFFRKKYSLRFSLIILPIIWVIFEWLYALTELSYPWLTIGYTQSTALHIIQFAEITGVFGISLWIMVMNCLFFLLIKTFFYNPIKVKIISSIILLLYIFPIVYSFFVEKKYEETKCVDEKIKAGIIQPNVDPWEKWEDGKTMDGKWKSIEQLLSLTSELQKKDSVQIVVWPENSILFDIQKTPYFFEKFKTIIDSLNVSIVSGGILVHYYFGDEKAPASSNLAEGTRLRYDAYNSVLFFQPHHNTVQTYSKMRLVPFAERVPYAETFSWLIEPLRWGVGISNWAIGEQYTIFEDSLHHTKFSSGICYESIFPEFVSSFVKNGAEFITIVTNDSWWGNTSGARQHSQYAIFRAIENRRWIVRAANGGISSFISPEGKMYNETKLYQQSTTSFSISPKKELTFYSCYGDWLPRFLVVFLVVYNFFVIVKNRKKIN